MKQWVISIVNCEDSGGEFFHLRMLGLALLVTYSIIINYVSGTLKINLFIIIASKVSEISHILHCGDTMAPVEMKKWRKIAHT